MWKRQRNQNRMDRTEKSGRIKYLNIEFILGFIRAKANDMYIFDNMKRVKINLINSYNFQFRLDSLC